MIEIKTAISLVAVILTFVGYIPYIHDTLKGKTTPHVFTWFIWAFVASIVFALQVVGGAGVGSWITLAIVIACSFICVLALRNGKKDITASDIFFLILSFFALALWLTAKQPVLSVILLTLIDVFSFVPTVRKSWDKPYSETLFSYQLNAFRQGLSVVALQHYNIVTWLYPASSALASATFAGILIIRRRKIGR